MSDFNTFTGKTVDEAIQEACKFFTTERDKLEVEIITGGSTGIFGLVGKKKAQVRARRRQDPTRVLEEPRKAAETKPAPQVKPKSVPKVSAPEASPPAQDTAQDTGPDLDAPQAPPQEKSQDKPQAKAQDRPREARQPRPPREPRAPRPPKEAREQKQPRPPKEPREAKEAGEAKPQREGGRSRSGGVPRPRREPQRPPREAHGPKGDGELDIIDDLPTPQDDQTPASQELLDLSRSIMTKLLTPILDQEPVMSAEGTASRVNVTVQDEEHSGLLIGREGQTLAALQYLANRILARQWQTPVRLQINTGDYREKQDDNLRKMAVYLADKAKTQGRAQSTKPLSSYHRRVIHMALQADETIQTRSKGEGPMKRVIIVPKRGKNGAPQQGQNSDGAAAANLAPATTEADSPRRDSARRIALFMGSPIQKADARQ